MRHPHHSTAATVTCCAIFALLWGWLAISAPPDNPPRPRERCKQLAAKRTAAANQVHVCEYIRATDSLQISEWSADLCSEPQPVTALCGFWYGAAPVYGQGNRWRRVDGSTLHEGRCASGQWVFILCPQREIPI